MHTKVLGVLSNLIVGSIGALVDFNQIHTHRQTISVLHFIVCPPQYKKYNHTKVHIAWPAVIGPVGGAL